MNSAPLFATTFAAILFQVKHTQSALDPVGTQAMRIERLWWIMFWICLVAYALTLGWLTVAMSRAKEPSVPEPLPPSTPEQDKRMTTVVAASVAVTTVVLFVLLFVNAAQSGMLEHPQSKNPMAIEVIGHQWWWEVHYPNAQADQIVVTANEIHVPVGVPVVVTGNSADVIHSFWAPNIQGKRDLIPGHTSSFWFQVEQEGRFRGQCAEFCGHQHAHMSFLLIAQRPEDFNAWLAQQQKPAVEPATDEQKRGRDIFVKGTCVMCHSIRGTDAGARTGPDLTHLASRETIAAGTLPNNRGSLGGWIMDAQGVKPGSLMPPQQLSGDDLQALIAYLESLK